MENNSYDIDHSHLDRRKRKPVCVRLRSSSTYILVTVSFALFTDMLIYSIIIPIIPFVIDAIDQGKPPSSFSGDVGFVGISNSGDASKGTAILLALYAAALIVGSPILGYIGDKTTYRRWPMMSGIIILFGSMFLFLFGTQYWMFAIARILQGFGNACVWVLGGCLLMDFYPQERYGEVIGKALVFNSLGLNAGSPIGGALFQHFGYYAPFLFCIAFTVIDFFLRFLVVERRNNPKEWFEPENTIEKNETSNEATESSDVKSHSGPSSDMSSASNNNTSSTVVEPKAFSSFDVFRYPRSVMAMCLSFVFGIGYNAFQPTIPGYLVVQWGYNSTQIGLVLLSQVLPTFISTPISGKIYDKYGPKILCTGSLVASSICIALMSIPKKNTPGGAVPLIVLFALQGFFAQGIVVPQPPELAKSVKDLSKGSDGGVARSLGLINISFGLGAIAGPLIGAFLYDKVGFSMMCIIVACLTIIMTPFALVFLGEKPLSFRSCKTRFLKMLEYK
ncbi:major facilitator superfamily domain-containing protein [Fennellomyces sp. T-0311]|nr:major facilitator superfamily domain-containing protein [Fennellomyces sp. T-0311]